MAASNRPIDSRTVQKTETLDARKWEAIEARMPASVKASSFVSEFGRAFACPECGGPSNGTCPSCGMTHPKLRDSPGQ